jgi:hypothetical protein
MSTTLDYFMQKFGTVDNVPLLKPQIEADIEFTDQERFVYFKEYYKLMFEKKVTYVKLLNRFVNIPRKASKNYNPCNHILKPFVMMCLSDGKILQCRCCGLTGIHNLVIDHKKRGGNQHRRELVKSGLGSPGSAMLKWLIINDFPDGYQILCWACNNSKNSGTHCRIHNKDLSI